MDGKKETQKETKKECLICEVEFWCPYHNNDDEYIDYVEEDETEEKPEECDCNVS